MPHEHDPAAPEQAQTSTERVSLQIVGMSCGHCVAAVKEALVALPGVQVERVEVGRATVQFDRDTVKPGEIANAIQDAGYTPEAPKEGPTAMDAPGIEH